MSHFNFPSGVHSVLVTPFDDTTGYIDYDSLKRWTDYQLSTDVAGLVLLGSTSESSMLSKNEKLDIVKKIHEWNMASQSPKFITVGISGSNDIRETIQFATECLGYCNSFMLTVPHYVKPPQAGLIDWFCTICSYREFTNVPFILYNIPGRACSNMLPSTVKTICDYCQNVVAIKEASGNLQQMEEIRSLVPNLKLFSGDDGLVIDVVKMGGCGVISVASNVLPKLMVELTKASLSGDFEKSLKMFEDSNMKSFIDVLFCESNPIPIKFMLYNTGLFESYQMRTPLIKLDKKNHERVNHLFNTISQYSRDCENYKCYENMENIKSKENNKTTV